MHYLAPYPWWWHPPHVARVRTNYVKWNNMYYEGGYDAPQPAGVGRLYGDRSALVVRYRIRALARFRARVRSCRFFSKWRIDTISNV